MASQHAIAFSDRVLGLGHMEAAAYGCSQLQTPSKDYNAACATDAAATEYLAYATHSAARGKIAPLSGMSAMPVWLTNGQRDSVVHPAVVASASTFYAKLGANVSAVVTVPGAEHAFVVDHACASCNACDYLGPPFVNDCSYDAAGAMLKHLYGGRLAKSRARVDMRQLFKIDQARYFPQLPSERELDMSRTAYAYVPRRCQPTRHRSNVTINVTGVLACPLHIVYHGCSSSADVLRMAIVENAGFNDWAESSSLIVLYPQTRGYACWDWDGQQTARPTTLFDTRQSPQMNTVNRMADGFLREVELG